MTSILEQQNNIWKFVTTNPYFYSHFLATFRNLPDMELKLQQKICVKNLCNCENISNYFSLLLSTIASNNTDKEFGNYNNCKKINKLNIFVADSTVSNQNGDFVLDQTTNELLLGQLLLQQQQITDEKQNFVKNFYDYSYNVKFFFIHTNFRN